MRKKILSFIIVLCLAFGLTAVVYADESYEYVYDEAGLLTSTEIQEINAKARYVSDTYDCGVYICATDDHTQYGYSNIYDFGREYYLSYELGKGEEYSGILLVLSMDERDYTIVVSGEDTSALFDDYALDVVCDEMLDDFGNNNWYEGFYDYIDACGYILETGIAATDENYQSSYTDVTDYDYGYYESTADEGWGIYGVLAAVGIPCIIALIVCLIFKGQMKSVYKGSGAREYISKDGFKLSERSDIFTHTTQVRNRIVTNNKPRGGSINIGGGRVGGSFSGRSGKF